MARKSIDFAVLDNVDISTSQTGTEIDLKDMDNVGIVYEWSSGSGATAGYLVAEVKNGDSSWATLTLSTTPYVNGASGSGYINIYQFSFKKLRISYVRTGGSGRLTATLYAKSSGA